MPAAIATITPSPIVENLRPGGLTVIYGPAGCGKTALARYLAKQMPDIVVADEDDVPFDTDKTFLTRAEAARDYIKQMVLNRTHGIWTITARGGFVGGQDKPIDLHSRGVERPVVEVASLVLAIDYYGQGRSTARSLKSRYSDSFILDFTLGPVA